MEHLYHTLNTISSPHYPNDNKNTRVLEFLSRVSIISKPCSSARVSAAIVHKNNIIAFATNEDKTHPFQFKFGKDNMKMHLHAEINVIKNALKILSQKELSKSTLYVARVKYVNEKRRAITWGLAKPCESCSKAIAAFNIDKICYTQDSDKGYIFE
jgi:tRNA(Arg) A34 adenosine deaminase TadA